MEKKKKIVFQSNFSKVKTGFGRNARAILTHLYNTGKYDIVEYCASPFRWNDPNCKNMPWPCYGCMPDSDQDFEAVLSDASISRAAQYGCLFIDRIIEQEKPDIYIGAEDIWAFNDYWNKPWWDKITSVLWTTIDSLPIINIARDHGDKIKNYWVWTDFAKEALHDLGHTHAKTVHGIIDTDKFFPLPQEEKLEFRKSNNIDEDTIIFGFVFRNQLRKLVWRLIEGFAAFKKEYPDTKAKLLLHTYWEEGWNIQEFLEEFGVDKGDVLTTYICNHCQHTEIKVYEGQGLECSHCGQAGLINPRTTFGCTEEDLNRVYNVMDAYIHPMTSGGLEMPIVEAMLTELPVATVPYSCGTEFTSQGFVYPLPFTEFREMVSNFRKALPGVGGIIDFMVSISEGSLHNSRSWDDNARIAREWAENSFSPKVVGKIVEDFIDAQPFTDYDFDFDMGKFNEEYPFKGEEDIPEDLDWLTDLYKGVFGMNEPPDSESTRDWMGHLEKGKSREEIYKAFINRALQENHRNEKLSFANLFEDNGKLRLVYVIPESLGDCMISLSILDELNKVYTEDKWDIYVSTNEQYKQVFEHLPYIKKIVHYDSRMDNFQWWEGCGNVRGLVDIAFLPHLLTQRIPSYTHNGLDLNQLQG
jgi:glycosyltransferase involved in cell wall biosynthesis